MMSNNGAEYKRRVHFLQKTISIIQLVIMVVGIGIFVLGVCGRPLIRITKPDFIPLVRWITNVMIGAGLTQVVCAGYDIFSSCWKLMWPLYLAIAATGLTVVLELMAIGSSLFLYQQAHNMVNEDLVHPWYWVECLHESNCLLQMMEYIHWLVMPQIALAGFSVLLQSVTVLLQGKFVKAIVTHQRNLREALERYQEDYTEQQFEEKQQKFEQQQRELEEKQQKYEESIKRQYDDAVPGPSTTSRDVETHDDSDDFLRPPYSDDDEGESQDPFASRSPRRVAFEDEQDGEISPLRRRRAGGTNGDIEMNSIHKTYEAQVHIQVNTPSPPKSILKGDHGYIAGSRVSLDIDKL